MLCSLIMAGGQGTRFWPASTENKPKQFLNLIGEKTMLQLTVDRCLRLMPIDKIFICTSQNYISFVKMQIPDLPDQNIIQEPYARNTAPCVLLSSLYINNIFPETKIAVFAADAIISKEQNFYDTIKQSEVYLESNKKGILTLGIVPSYPETGYGYIKVVDGTETVLKVQKFVEKPNFEIANKYLAEGNYLWNAGMFIFNNNYLISLAKQLMKDTYDKLSNLPFGKEDYLTKLEQVYLQCERISFDYAIAERCEDMYVIKSDLDWDDVGSWKSLERYLNKDKYNNVSKGNIKYIESNNNIVFACEKDIVFYGVSDLVCIESEDKIIVTTKDNIDIIHTLKEKVNEG